VRLALMPAGDLFTYAMGKRNMRGDPRQYPAVHLWGSITKATGLIDSFPADFYLEEDASRRRVRNNAQYLVHLVTSFSERLGDVKEVWKDALIMVEDLFAAGLPRERLMFVQIFHPQEVNPHAHAGLVRSVLQNGGTYSPKLGHQLKLDFERLVSHAFGLSDPIDPRFMRRVFVASPSYREENRPYIDPILQDAHADGKLDAGRFVALLERSGLLVLARPFQGETVLTDAGKELSRSKRVPLYPATVTALTPAQKSILFKGRIFHRDWSEEAWERDMRKRERDFNEDPKATYQRFSVALLERMRMQRELNNLPPAGKIVTLENFRRLIPATRRLPLRDARLSGNDLQSLVPMRLGPEDEYPFYSDFPIQTADVTDPSSFPPEMVDMFLGHWPDGLAMSGGEQENSKRPMSMDTTRTSVSIAPPPPVAVRFRVSMQRRRRKRQSVVLELGIAIATARYLELQALDNPPSGPILDVPPREPEPELDLEKIQQEDRELLLRPMAEREVKDPDAVQSPLNAEEDGNPPPCPILDLPPREREPELDLEKIQQEDREFALRHMAEQGMKRIPQSPPATQKTSQAESKTSGERLIQFARKIADPLFQTIFQRTPHHVPKQQLQASKHPESVRGPDKGSAPPPVHKPVTPPAQQRQPPDKETTPSKPALANPQTGQSSGGAPAADQAHKQRGDAPAAPPVRESIAPASEQRPAAEQGTAPSKPALANPQTGQSSGGAPAADQAHKQRGDAPAAPPVRESIAPASEQRPAAEQGTAPSMPALANPQTGESSGGAPAADQASKQRSDAPAAPPVRESIAPAMKQRPAAEQGTTPSEPALANPQTGQSSSGAPAADQASKQRSKPAPGPNGPAPKPVPVPPPVEKDPGGNNSPSDPPDFSM
jgi:hypothetical protein